MCPKWTSRNPYKTRLKTLKGESGHFSGTRFPPGEGKRDQIPFYSIYIYICCRSGILANSEGESWPSSPSRCRTEHFVRGNPGQIQWRQTQGLLWPGSPPLGDQIPPNDFLSLKRLVQQLANCPRNHYFYSGFIQTCLLLYVCFEGGIFVHFLFFGLVFFVPPFRHSGRWKLLKTLVL